MSKFTEYLEATKENKTAGIPAIKEHLKYIGRYIDKANKTPGVLESLEDIKKRMMKTTISRPEGHITKKQIALNEAKAREICKDFEDIIQKKNYDYWNKTLKLGLSKADKEKDYDSVYWAREEGYMDDYGLDDTSSKDDKIIKGQVDSIFEKGSKNIDGTIFNLTSYDRLKFSQALFDKLGLDESLETPDIEVALKAYKTLTGKEYKQ